MKNLDIIVPSILGLMLILLMISFPMLTGSTFGQRCAKAYPDDLAQQERCVRRAADGGYVYPEPSSEGNVK